MLFNYGNRKLQWGYLLTWQASLAGDDARAGVNQAAFQPFLVYQLNGGWYLRSTAISTYDVKSNNYNFPIGLGVGKVIKADKSIVNIFVEPQYSIASRGDGQADWGVFGGVNFQFPK